MIEVRELVKKFDKVVAIDNININVENGTVLGLVGSNGSGKSTFLRTLSGVYSPDYGKILIDGENVFENQSVKSKCYFVSDFPFFYNHSTISNLAFLFKRIYPNWSDEKFAHYCSIFPINPKARIINMSKGMQRQAALILALSTCPSYLFLDEIFDGLDPVVRQLLKQILADNVSDTNMTVIIASHNLRELEDLCDRICLMHHGKVLMERDIDSLRAEMCKVQIAFVEPPTDQNIFEGLEILNIFRNGNIFNLTVKGQIEDIMPKLNALNPAYVSSLPLTLEEIFISEMGVAGYDTNSIV